MRLDSVMLYVRQNKHPLGSNLQWSNREFKGHVRFRQNLVLVMDQIIPAIVAFYTHLLTSYRNDSIMYRRQLIQMRCTFQFYAVYGSMLHSTVASGDAQSALLIVRNIDAAYTYTVTELLCHHITRYVISYIIADGKLTINSRNEREGVMKKILEVIATTPEDAVIAEQAGADRIEWIAAQQEGGLTPSLGLIEQVTEMVSIPVHVMVRPHSRHFRYDEAELSSMVRDIRHIARTRTTAIVTGVLTADQQIDTTALERLLDAADGKPFTFHRAFDELDDLERGLDVLARYPQITRILTSGGQPSVLQAQDQLIALNRLARQYSIQIIAGAGLTLESLADFVTYTSIQEVHLGSTVRINSDISEALDPERIARAQHILQSC